MKISRQNTANQEVELAIKLTAEETNKYRTEAAKMIAKHIKVKGFRQGHAPEKMVREQIGEPHFHQEVLNIALPDVCNKAIAEEKINLLAQPKVEVKSVDPIEFTAVFPLLPEVKLKKLDKLKIKRNPVKVEQEEIDGTIYEFQKYLSTYKDVDRTAEKGDRVEIDFAGYDDGGAALDKTTSKNHPLIIGDNTFVPGFEENLIGLKAGDKKEFTVTFPKDYHRADFQNKKVTFKVEVKRVESVELATIDAEFSKKIIGKELEKDEFIKTITEDIKKQKEAKEDQRQQAELFEELLKHVDITISPILYEEELNYLLHQQKHELEHRGIAWEDFLKMLAEKGRDLRSERMEEAEKRTKVRFIIKELLEKGEIKVSDEDVLAKLQEQGADKKDINTDSQAFHTTKDQLVINEIFDRFLEKAK